MAADVYKRQLPETVRDDTALNPQSSYGTQKAIAELLLADYTRRGFVDGRALRLPTISVRPGRPNAAASSFASGIIREPLNGEPAACPVTADTRPVSYTHLCLRHLLVAVALLSANAAALAESRQYTAVAPDGVTLVIQESGDPAGPAVVFVHGLLGSRLSWEAPLSSPLLQRYRLITYDPVSYTHLDVYKRQEW